MGTYVFNNSLTVILVTGATGFLGYTLVKQLLSEGEKNVIATRRSHSIIPSDLKNREGLTWVEADVKDYIALADVFEKSITKVYHCAAVVSFHPKDVKEMMEINVKGTTHIVNLCLKHEARLVYVSSIAAIGAKDGTLVTEKEKWEFNSRESAYSISKYKSEMEVWRGIEEGLEAVIVNPSVIMGEHAGPNGSEQILQFANKGLGFYPLGATGIVDVHDVAKLMTWLMNSEVKGERYILNSGNISNKELLIKISKFLNKPKPKIPANRYLMGIAWRLTTLWSYIAHKKLNLTKDAARATQNYYTFSNEKIKKLTHFEFKSIDDILKEITQQFKSNQTKKK